MRQTSFVITNTEYIKYETKFNISQLDECEKVLKTYYDFAQYEPLYIFIVNTFKEGMSTNKTVFEIYYQFNNLKLTQLDLSLCGNMIQNTIINCSSYSIESILNDSCIICRDGYYPIHDETNLYNTPFKKCYKNLEGYFLSEKDEAYKKCYHSCHKCDTNGSELYHNCEECRFDYFF